MRTLLLLPLLLIAALAASPAEASAAAPDVATPDVALADLAPAPLASAPLLADTPGPAFVATPEAPDEAPNAGGLAGAVLTALSMGAMGTVLTLRTKNEDGNFRTHTLDSESDQFGAQMQDYRDAVVAEAERPLQADLSAAQAASGEYRDLVIDEILRVETLANTDAEGTLAEDFSAEDERAFYESLTPKKLALHFKKAREKTVDLKPQTSPDAPSAPDAAYGHVTVN